MSGRFHFGSHGVCPSLWRPFSTVEKCKAWQWPRKLDVSLSSILETLTFRFSFGSLSVSTRSLVSFTSLSCSLTHVKVISNLKDTRSFQLWKFTHKVWNIGIGRNNNYTEEDLEFKKIRNLQNSIYENSRFKVEGYSRVEISGSSYARE